MATSLALETAEAALQRGDYGQCLTFLEPLAKEYPLPSKEGAEIRMLMITAWMGQGDDQQAIALCRLLTKGKESEIKQQAKQLISILEAPTLPRPDNWSITLPNINLSAETGEKLMKSKRKKKKASFTYPPTGPTKAFDIGYAIFSIAILILLTIFLSK